MTLWLPTFLEHTLMTNQYYINSNGYIQCVPFEQWALHLNITMDNYERIDDDFVIYLDSELDFYWGWNPPWHALWTTHYLLVSRTTRNVTLCLENTTNSCTVAFTTNTLVECSTILSTKSTKRFPQRIPSIYARTLPSYDDLHHSVHYHCLYLYWLLCWH